MKKIILIVVLLIGQLVYAQTEYKGQELLEKLKGKTLKNYPTSTVRGYVNEKGKLFLKIGAKGNKKYKGQLNKNMTDNIEWKKGKEGSSTLTLTKVSVKYWTLKDNKGFETPTFKIKDGNYFKY